MFTLNPLSYLLPFLGSLVGMGIAYYVTPRTPERLKLILSFSGAFLLGIIILHLIPQVFSETNSQAGLWIIAGLILQILLEYLSQGTEHGHAHLKEDNKTPIILILSLCIHAFIEGLPLGQEPKLIWGIFIHKIPIGMVLFFIVWGSKSNLLSRLLYLILFSLMSPLGSLTLSCFDTLTAWQLPITALVIGMLLHISTTILFESNQGHSFNLRKLLIILAAFGFSYLI
jgi:zinc transporter ZupT